MKRFSQARTWLLLAAVAALVSGTVWAAKPAPPPPPPPTSGPEVYEWRQDLGGWLDTSTNVVWGYSLMQLRNSATSYNSAQMLAQSYSGLMEEQANGFAVLAAAACDDAAVAYSSGDTEVGDLKTAEGDRYLELIAVCDDVGSHTDWRLPTIG